LKRGRDSDLRLAEPPQKPRQVRRPSGRFDRRRKASDYVGCGHEVVGYRATRELVHVRALRRRRARRPGAGLSQRRQRHRWGDHCLPAGGECLRTDGQRPDNRAAGRGCAASGDRGPGSRGTAGAERAATATTPCGRGRRSGARRSRSGAGVRTAPAWVRPTTCLPACEAGRPPTEPCAALHSAGHQRRPDGRRRSAVRHRILLLLLGGSTPARRSPE